jgi:hypothetical protein
MTCLVPVPLIFLACYVEGKSQTSGYLTVMVPTVTTIHPGTFGCGLVSKTRGYVAL